MAYTLAPKTEALTPYDPVEGEYRVRLDANESFLLPTDTDREKMARAAAEAALNRYPDPLATRLCEAFAARYQVKPALVTAGNGSDELISIILSTFLQKGEKVLTLSPDFSMYAFYTSITETPCITLPKKPDMTVDVTAVIDTIRREGVRLLIFSNPCNPTSVGLPRDGVRRILRETDALVVLDEAYMDFWDQSLINEVEKYSNLIIFRTASKAVGSAALRLGFAVANETISRAVKAVKSPYNVNTFSQVVGSIIYKNKDYLKNRQKTIVRNREKLYNDLLELSALSDDFKVYNSCANFVFVKTSFGKDLWNYLKDNSIVIRFMGDYIRISVGTEEENEELISCIKTYLSR